VRVLREEPEEEEEQEAEAEEAVEGGKTEEHFISEGDLIRRSWIELSS